MSSSKLELALEAKQVTAACAQIATWKINGQSDLDDLTSGMVEAQARLKFLEESRLAETKPDRDKVAERNARSKPAEDAYKALKLAIGARITLHHQTARAASETARIASHAAQQQAHAAAELGNLPAAAALQTKAFTALAAAPVLLETDGTHTRREWRIRVVNKALVNPVWLIVDEAALLEHARKVLPKATPEADVSAFRVNGVEVYLHEHEVVTGR